jgi:hypothetical protein
MPANIYRDLIRNKLNVGLPCLLLRGLGVNCLLEPTTGIEPVNLFLTKEVLYLLSYVGRTSQRLSYKNAASRLGFPWGSDVGSRVALESWSGKRDSNPRRSAWKADALPTELFPRILSRPPFRNCMVEGGGFEPPKAEPTDLQSAPFGRSGTPPSWSWRWDSNPQPADYKSAALPVELRQQKAPL